MKHESEITIRPEALKPKQPIFPTSSAEYVNSLYHNEAMGRRLRRNYIWLFLIMLLAWLLKITTSSLQPGARPVQLIHSTGELFNNAAIGYFPGWLIVIIILGFYGWLVYIIIKHREKTGQLA